jgi:steroid delta-isomerase-like uncharacterized protein
MSAQENKALNRRLIEEGFNKQNMAVIEELIATDHLDHAAFPGVLPGLEGVKQLFTMFWAAFPDVHVTVEDQVAEGDKVVNRITWRGTHQGTFLGVPATGKQVTVAGIDIGRWADGKAVEHWNTHDFLGLIQHLGVIPEME